MCEPLSLYVHIPFCAVKCSYCAFNVYANAERLIPAYLDALCGEIRQMGRGAIKPLHSVYFGGGTPSLLTVEQVAQVMHGIRESFNVTDAPELSFEVNPDMPGTAYFEGLRELGINRLSIGMQSAHAAELKLFARQHTADMTAQTVAQARAAGFDNISLDLIYGVPNQTLAMWRESLHTALALQPEHFSLYSLQVEPDTPFEAWVASGKLPASDDDLAADMYEAADELLSAAGMVQYEISTWSKPGRMCQHNLQYWTHGDYLGIGAGAHGFAENMRYTVVRPLQKYIDLAAGTGTYPLPATAEHGEPISRAQAMDEVMITGLRLLQTGVNRAAFAEQFGVMVEQVYGERLLTDLQAQGLIRIDPDAIRLTTRARLIANRVLVHFMRDA
jgi:oxygen-independent coproporphyrinogen III oxidase